LQWLSGLSEESCESEEEEEEEEEEALNFDAELSTMRDTSTESSLITMIDYSADEGPADLTDDEQAVFTEVNILPPPDSDPCRKRRRVILGIFLFLRGGI